MKKQRGFIVSYVHEKTGKLRKAFVYYKDQTEEHEKLGKFFCRMVNDDFTPCEIKGKQVSGLKHSSELTVIGHID